VTAVVRELCKEANYELAAGMGAAITRSIEDEESPVGREVLAELIANADLAQSESVPICQDTGMAVVFLELGQDVHIVGGDLYLAIDEGVRQGYNEGYLRNSVVADPLIRQNTGDNTPAFIRVQIVPGDKLRVHLLPKGGGSENVSRLAMLKPAQGVAGVKDFVLSTVDLAGGNACPPYVVGVGIGGTFDECAFLAKLALMRPVGSPSSRPHLAQLEQELLAAINDLGIGPQGYGGRVTALAVHIEATPTHIACLPVAVNLSCHALRHKMREI